MPGTLTSNRIKPSLGPESYKSYSIRYPLSTHWRRATCEEAECNGWRLGWVTTVDISTELGQRQYHYLTHDKTRTATEAKIGPSLVTFTYGPGFTCFQASDHRVKAARPPLMLVTGGDWRGNPRGTAPYTHTSAENWADDFATHQSTLARAFNGRS